MIWILPISVICTVWVINPNALHVSVLITLQYAQLIYFLTNLVLSIYLML